MKDECLICGAPLTYLENDTEMKCVICHKKKTARPLAKKGIMFVTNVTQVALIPLLLFVLLKLQRILF